MSKIRRTVIPLRPTRDELLVSIEPLERRIAVQADEIRALQRERDSAFELRETDAASTDARLERLQRRSLAMLLFGAVGWLLLGAFAIYTAVRS